MSKHHSEPSSFRYAAASKPSLVGPGGALGIAASIIGMLIFCAACAGFDAAFTLSIIPFLLGLVGMVLTLIGATVQKSRVAADTHVLAALFASFLGLVGGLLLIAVWRGWPLLPGSGGI